MLVNKITEKGVKRTPIDSDQIVSAHKGRWQDNLDCTVVVLSDKTQIYVTDTLDKITRMIMHPKHKKKYEVRK